MKVEKLVLGPIRTNCYIIIKNGKCIIVDPADNFAKINDYVKKYQVVGCLVTHYHFDHVDALDEVLREYKLKANPDTVEDFEYEIIKTPGHAEDSLTFYFKEEHVMFTGDFLFYNTIGRTDLEGSNPEDMRKSLSLIAKYPDDIKIYPGHGKESYLATEKKNFDYYYRIL